MWSKAEAPSFPVFISRGYGSRLARALLAWPGRRVKSFFGISPHAPSAITQYGSRPSPGRLGDRAALISSPSLPRRDDLDLIAVLELRLGPAAFRHHVIVERDRKMCALIVELAQKRVDAT